MASSFVLIGGAPKCGTTSLFNYLSDHPTVCPANRKETYFFARNFVYNRGWRTGETTQDFMAYFSHARPAENLYLEATPYTLYADGAAHKVDTLLPDARMIFILRDPVRRLISDYQSHVIRGHRDGRFHFSDFLDRQLRHRGTRPSLIDLGEYIKYLPAFWERLGRDRVTILFLEELVRRPQAYMQHLCGQLGIRSDFYHNYSFSVHNPAVPPRSALLYQAYMKLEPFVADWRANLMRHRHTYPLVESILDTAKRIYRTANGRDTNSLPQASLASLKRLANHYEPYNRALASELGRPLPWSSVH
jgi:hypothetical protein